MWPNGFWLADGIQGHEILYTLHTHTQSFRTTSHRNRMYETMKRA